MSTTAGLSRRQVLLGGTGVAAATAMSACAGPVSQGGGAASGGSLEIWTRETGQEGARQPLVQERLAAFDAENGTSTTAQFLVFAESVQKTQAALAAGNPPDVGQQGPDVSLSFASAGDLVDLTDVFDSLSDSFVSLERDAYVELDGSTWAIPWYLETRVLLYHRDLVEEAGVEPPTTWEEWRAFAAALTRGEEQFGFAMGPEGPGPGQLLMPLATSAGASMIAADGTVGCDTDEHRAALQLLSDMYVDGSMPAALPTYKGNDLTQLFIQKRLASYWSNAEVLQAAIALDPSLADTVGAVVTPVRSVGDVSRSFLGGFQLFAFAATTEPDLAKELIAFMLDEDWYREFVTFTNGAALPVLSSVAQDPLFAQDDVLSVITEQLPTAVRYGGVEYGNAPWIGEAEGNGLFSRAVLDVLTGSQDVESAIARLDVDVKRTAGQ